MSQYIHGVPRDIALELKEQYRLDTFIETGTLVGYSAVWAAKHFNRVFTIEFFDEHYQQALNNLVTFKNVVCIKNTGAFGIEEVRSIWGALCFPLFWLDAHWSDGIHYGRPDMESDVANEIAFVNLWKSQHAIIVDDAHKFSTQGWPELDFIIYLLANYGKRQVIRVYDVLVAVPCENPIVVRGHYHVTKSIDDSAVA